MSHTSAHKAALSRYPTLDDMRAAAHRLAGKVLPTPVWRWQTGVIADMLSPDTEVWLKLELLQKTGTFKLRGALNCIEALSDEEREHGVVAASAGNHALAVAYAARLAGTHAKVLMPHYASPVRIEGCRAQGAEVVLTTDLHEAFERAQQIARTESRSIVHPFDGPLTAAGTGTIGVEFVEQVRGLDAVIVPVGGGGLCAGIAAAVKQLVPECRVYGVEPFGADAMYHSFLSGRTERIAAAPQTIADSLAAPCTLDYSLAVCQRFVDQIVRVSDEELRRAMFYLYRDMKLVAEPAAAASTAALLGPLRETLDGQRVGLIACGSNIDVARFAELVNCGVEA
jgi:threonine dehydratase